MAPRSNQLIIHSVFFSFFPNVCQPFISVLVNPIHVFCLQLGVIRPHAPPRSSTSSSLTSVVSIPGVDMNDMERRRQIALKALNERLSRTTDASRQNILPKSFPHSHHQGHSHGGHHAHGGHHGHHAHGSGHGHHHGGHGGSSGGGGGQPSFIAPGRVPMTSFIPPAIPLPPPTSLSAPAVGPSGSATIVAASSEQSSSTQNDAAVVNLIDINDSSQT